MKKNRKMTDFQDVAKDIDEIKINVNDQENVHDDIDEILNQSEKMEKTHVLKGFYLDKDVARAIDRVSRGKARGTKSRLVNELIRKGLKEKGIM